MTPHNIAGLEVILTAGCNLRCAYCYQDDKKARSMSWDTLRAALDLVLRSRRPVIKVLFIGGEPLLEFPLLKRAVAYVEEMRPEGMSFRYTIFTNGMLLRDEQAEFLVRHDFDVQLSFDGVPALQDLRGKGTFVVLDALLERLKRGRPDFFARKLRVSQTLLARTLPWFADSVRYFLDKGVRDIRVSPAITAQPDWRVDRIEELDRVFKVVFENCLRHFRRTGEVPFVLFRRGETETIDRTAERPMCGVAHGGNLAVDVDGEALGCVTFARSYQTFPTIFLRNRMEALRMGGIQDPALADRMAAFPAAVRATGLFHDKRTKYSSYGRCGDCRYLSTCGFCPVSIGHQPGNTDPDRVPDFLCAFNLVSQKYRDQFPRTPTVTDMWLGLSPLPELLQEFERAVAPIGAKTEQHHLPI